MANTLDLLTANRTLLAQAVHLLDGLDATAYTQTAPPLYTSGVGGHLRHVLDHVVAFLDGCAQGEVDYDARAREAVLERDPAAMRAALRAVDARLGALGAADLERPLRVRMDCGPAAPWAGSSVARELQFLVGHATHHFALIALMLRHQGRAVDADLGVAASTRHHRERLAGAPAR